MPHVTLIEFLLAWFIVGAPVGAAMEIFATEDHCPTIGEVLSGAFKGMICGVPFLVILLPVVIWAGVVEVIDRLRSPTIIGKRWISTFLARPLCKRWSR